ncbi:PREDICTED: protein PF14_0175-like [Polistes dominula]|uniref:Protein PF14_0175-like n=1 Tax=Polistes dominula TaxID=743375 RepID=A0ABM1II88_POLDO|nr:PREDICTED: protein PF14_0175-like [Polistes dominula]
MASREKRPLAPSKSKQKANNDSGLPSNEVKSRKGKSLSNIKQQQQLARDIFDAVATGSQLPAKLEASLPRKKVLKNLKRKQNLRVTKANNFINTKVTKKVGSKNLCRINSDIKKGIKARKVKSIEEKVEVKEEDEEEEEEEEEKEEKGETDKSSDINLRTAENHINDSESSKTTETTNKSAKINLRTKKTKSLTRITNSEQDNEDNTEKDQEALVNLNTTKGNTKNSKRSKVIDTTVDSSSPRSAKLVKNTGLKKSTIKEKENYTKVLEGDKYLKGKRGTTKDTDSSFNNIKSNVHNNKLSKSVLDNKSSIDLTIDEVIASMLSDSEVDNQQGIVEKVDGKITRSRKMLVDENIIPESEIKKESDCDDIRTMSEGECGGDIEQGNHTQTTIQLRKRSNALLTQRSLRNGKLRQLSETSFGNNDMEIKKGGGGGGGGGGGRRLNSDDPAASETSTEQISDGNVDLESCFSESSGNYSQIIIKEEIIIKDDVVVSKNYAESETAIEIENNNNSERGGVDRLSEIGPILRSKTKARSTDNDNTKVDDIKIEETRVVAHKNVEVHEEVKKTNNIDLVRKDTILSKLNDRSNKGRRNSLNIDMRKTVNSFYGTEKSDGNPKSKIDQMIENIKLTIAKSIESKMFGPEKNLGLGKNFEIPNMEEIIAPLSTESQKLGLDESNDEDKPNASKNESKSENSENSVPKVADTAKEIEKLVMGDIELVETQSQNTQDNRDETPNIEAVNKTHNSHEPSQATVSNKEINTCKDVKESNNEVDQDSNITSKVIEQMEDTESQSINNSKKVSPLSRKSAKSNDKHSQDNIEESEIEKKLPTLSDESNEKHDSLQEKINECMQEDKKPISESEEDNNKELEKIDVTNESTKILLSSTEINESVKAQNETIEINTEVDKINCQQVESLSTGQCSEESETLESIYSDVERLVKGDELSTLSEIEENKETNSDNNVKLNDTCNDDIVKDAESSSSIHTKDEGKLILDKIEETLFCEERETILEDINEYEKNLNDNESVEKIILGSSELLQNQKDERNHSELPTINNDLNSISTCTSKKEINDKNDSVKDVISSQDKEDTKHQNNDTSISSNKIKSNEEMIDKKVENNLNTTVEDKNNKLCSEKNNDESKTTTTTTNEENKRVLRVRDKQKKVEKRPTSCNKDHENASKTSTVSDCQSTEECNNAQNDNKQNLELKTSNETTTCKTPETDVSQNSTTDLETSDVSETHPRTRRGREVKKRKEDQQSLNNNTFKNKRAKRDNSRKSDQQKEETLLDNEVAKINENNRFLNDYNNLAKCSDSFRGFSEGGGRNSLDKIQGKNDNLRSKSENDLVIPNESTNRSEEGGRLLSQITADNDLSSKETNDNLLDECKSSKIEEVSQKDLDDTSISDESSSSVNIGLKILETPEDKAKKESILRILGLESLEKAAERVNNQKARKEQYTGTLKTVIRVQKEKEKDKKRSRSPLKMVLKQGRNDGEGDSPDFYTIQKEFGTSGLGDSSSDEDNEEAPPKDRQSLVIPEKSSSFSIHPGRLCADVCCYCFGKFGSLDTPMHLAQMKSDERRKKILIVERHLNKDSCLCDACYRHVDRKANTSPTNMQAKPQKHRQLMVSKCAARDCRDPARHNVKRRWLLKIKAGLQSQVDIDWESSQHTSMSFCVVHYSKVEIFLTCALCNRRLARNHTHLLTDAETVELNQRLSQQAIPVSLSARTFVCKLCRYFTQLQIKYKDPENMSMNHRSFYKSYRKRILHNHDIEVLENEEEDSNSQSKDKDKRKKAKCPPAKNGNSKSPDVSTNSTSDKSTPESIKNEVRNSEQENDNRSVKMNTTDDTTIPADIQFLCVEGSTDKLNKKRKVIDVNNFTSDGTMPCDVSNEVVEILTMDKEVTLTKLPKKARTSNDITPVVQRLGANPSISVRTLFPGEEEMNLHANIEFGNVREMTPQGWEKCATMIQYDRDTKLLWQELQRPYGNQSSFLRHLILLEKYYRAGDLILAPNASRNAINYSTSVQNRLISYEGPEKMDEPIMEPISNEFHNSRRLSGGYVLERDRHSLPMGSSTAKSPVIQLTTKGSPPRAMKLNSGVSIIKKPPPNLQRLSLPSTSSANGNNKRKDSSKLPMSSGGKVFQMTDPEYKRLQNSKKPKQMFSDKQCASPTSSGSGGGGGGGGVGSSSSSSGVPSGNSNSPPNFKSTTQYQKAVQYVAQTQFQQHLRRQQEMLNRQTRGDFEPLICDMRTSNENSPTQNLIHNLNLPKSIQVTTKPSNPIPILPKIPKSLTVIPQTVTRPTEK